MRRKYPAMRARFLKQHPNDQRPWTLEDQKILIEHWPKMSARELARMLGRTESAVRRRVRMVERPDMTLREFSRHTGFSRSSIRRALDVLGIKMRERRVTYRRGWRKGARWAALTPAVQERLLRYLTGSRRDWGIEGRPTTCADCGTREHPHYAKGMCRRCYDRHRKRVRRRQQR